MDNPRTNYQPPVSIAKRPVSDLIVEAFRNGHPIWQIAARCGVPRSRVTTVLVQKGEMNALDTTTEPVRAITHDRSKVVTSGPATT